MSADEDENEKVIREKTDGGLTLLGEGVRQDEGAAPHIRRLALTPPGSTLDRNSVMDSIVETLQLFTKDFSPIPDIIECSGMGLGLSDVNLDEIGTTVRAALGGLKVATTMRCRIRDGITGAASQ